MSNDTYGFVVDKFIANRIQSSYIRSQNINSQKMAFRSLKLDGTIRDLDPMAPNFDFTQFDTDYEDPWKPSWSASNKAYALDSRQQGAVISNGKITLFSSFDQIDVQKTYIITNTEKERGTHGSNVIEPFYVTGISCFQTDTDNLSVYTQKQTLNLQTATLHTSYNVIDKLSGKNVVLDVDMYTPRHIPSAVCQKVWIKRPHHSHFPDDSNTLSIPFFHQVYNKSNIRDVSYNNNIVHYETSRSESVYILNGQGKTDSGHKVAFATIYVLSNTDRVENMGFNLKQGPYLTCVNKFNIMFKKTDSTDKKIAIDIFSIIMTDYDFTFPLDEAKKLALSVYLGSTSPSASFTRLRTDHVNAWAHLWNTNIIINPKKNITAEEEEKLHKLNRIVRMCLYNLYSISRDKGFLFPDTFPIIDPQGQLMYEGDLWLMPVLLFLKPHAARSVLEHRYKNLDTAKHTANSYGHSGAKFPYAPTHGIVDIMLWNAETSLGIFNNALIVISTWNYYRITRDKDFLINKGHPIMRNIIEFLTDLTELDTEQNIYVLKNVVGLNNRESKRGNAFVNNLIKLALRFFFESSYELGYFVPDEWSMIYHTLPVHLYGSDEGTDIDIQKVIKFDKHSLLEDKYDILETLYILTPYLSRLFFSHGDFMGEAFNYNAIKQNIDFYEKRRKSATQKHPYNILVLAILYAIYAQHDESFVTHFQDYLDMFLENYVDGIWHHMHDFNVSKPMSSFNMNAAFLMVLLQSMAGIHITGGVSESTFYYEEMGIKTAESRNMPKYWANMIVQGFDQSRKTSSTRNRILYLKQQDNI